MGITEDEAYPILHFLETIYKKYAAELSRHISENGGGDYDVICSAIQSFKISQDPKESVLQEEPPDIVEQKEPAKVHSQLLYKIIIFYSEKYHAIFGSKNSIKPIFDKIGGRFQFNSNLSRGKGWIFPFNKLEALELELNAQSLAYTIENGPFFEKLEESPPPSPPSSPSPPSPPSSPKPQPTDTTERRIIRLNRFGNHEDTSTGLVFKQIEGIVSAYGIQSPDGEVIAISDELRLYCQQKGYPIAELDEWEEEEEYSSSEYENDTETDKDNTNDNDKDMDSLKDISDNEMTDGEDIIDDENDEDDSS